MYHLPSLGPMQITVTYRRTSRLSLRVTPKGKVNVSAPFHTPETTIRQFIANHRQWIEDSLRKMEGLHRQRTSFYDQLPLCTPGQRAEAAARLDSIVRPLVARYAPLMDVEPPYIDYKPFISKWGDCVPARNHITISLYALLLPTWCIEHVVVHELVHLLVPDHSDRFRRLLTRYFPRWREARAETRRIMYPKQ